MGLKTTNYKVKTGDVLPSAYAIFSDIRKIGGNLYEATFSIYRDRDAFGKTAPYETKSIKFVWDRRQDLVSQAYFESKKIIENTRMNEETGEEEVYFTNGIFTGWIDDIV